jgi:flagellar biosynthesis/type III secretory pathway M-ring protein FliF/YscJ
MNEELQQAIVKVIESMTGVAQSAYSFGAEQLPDVVQQLLLWHMMHSMIFFGLGLILLAASVFMLIRKFSGKQLAARKAAADNARRAYEAGESWTRYDKSSSVTSIMYDDIMKRENAIIVDERDVLSCLGTSIFGVVGLSVMFSNLTWLHILVAPKVWLIEYAAGLVK